jgi:putative Holliday junction resolvase
VSRLRPDHYLALDLGDRRVGIAAGCSASGLARPLETFDRTAGEAALLHRIRELMKREEAATILIGDALNMDGTRGERSELAHRFAKSLKGAIRQARIVLYDERLSSFTADEWMERDGIKPARRKSLRDSYAAAAILQEYFAAQQMQEPSDPSAGMEE